MNKQIFIGTAMLMALASCNNNTQLYDATGIFEATEVTVSAKSQGEIVRLTCEEGDEVKANTCLGVIDTTALLLQKKNILANVSATEAGKLDISAQVAAIQQQKSNAQQELTRFEHLLSKGAATQKQVDDIKYQIATYDKQVAALNNSVGTANLSIQKKSSALLVQVQQVQKQIADCHIVCPIEGTILNKYVEQGEYAAPGKPIVKVADLNRMRLRAYVSQPQLTKLKLGQQVKVFADWGENEQKEYKGVITWISDKAEFTPKTIQTRDERTNLVYAVKISVTNDGTIKRGMYGNVSFGE